MSWKVCCPVETVRQTPIFRLYLPPAEPPAYCSACPFRQKPTQAFDIHAKRSSSSSLNTLPHAIPIVSEVSQRAKAISASSRILQRVKIQIMSYKSGELPLGNTFRPWLGSPRCLDFPALSGSRIYSLTTAALKHEGPRYRLML